MKDKIQKNIVSVRTTQAEYADASPEENEFPPLREGCPSCAAKIPQGLIDPRLVHDLVIEQRIGPYIVAHCRNEGCGWRGELSA